VRVAGSWPICAAKAAGFVTVAIPLWVKHGIDAWMVAAKIEKGRLLRPLSKSGKVIGDELGDWAIWSVVEQSANEIGIEHFGAHICAGHVRSSVARTVAIWNRSSFHLGIARFKLRSATSGLSRKSPRP
jgi:hypothetical protein